MIDYTPTPDFYNDYICHYGVKGMKWHYHKKPKYADDTDYHKKLNSLSVEEYWKLVDASHAGKSKGKSSSSSSSKKTGSSKKESSSSKVAKGSTKSTSEKKTADELLKNNSEVPKKKITIDKEVIDRQEKLLKRNDELANSIMERIRKNARKIKR